MFARLIGIGAVLLLGLMACEGPPAATSPADLGGHWDQLRSPDRVAQTITYSGTIAHQPARLTLDHRGGQRSGTLTHDQTWALQERTGAAENALILEGEGEDPVVLRLMPQPGGAMYGEWITPAGQRVDSVRLEREAQTFFLADSLLVEGRLDLRTDTLRLIAPGDTCRLIFTSPVCAGLAPAAARRLNQALGPPPRQELGRYMAYCLTRPDSLIDRRFVRTYEAHALLPGWLSLSYFYTGPDTAYSRSLLANLATGELAHPGILLGGAWPEALIDRVRTHLRTTQSEDWALRFDDLPRGMHLELYSQHLVVRLDPLALGPHAPGYLRLSFSYAELAEIMPPASPLARLP